MAFLLPIAYVRYTDAAGNPLDGALAHIYQAGTTTPVTTYTTSALSVANSNPLESSSAGIFPIAYIADGSADIDIIIRDSADSTTYFTLPNISAPDALSSSALLRTYVTKSSDYTVVAADNAKVIDFDASGGDRTATLDSDTLGNGFWVTIGRRSTSGNVILSPVGGQTIDGDGYTIDTDYERVTLVSMGATGWVIAARTSVEPVGEVPQIITDASTARTLAITDKGALIKFTSNSSITVTIPTNAAVPFPIGTRIEFEQAGNGEITFSAASPPTLETAGSFIHSGVQYSACVLTKTAVNTWWLAGDTD